MPGASRSSRFAKLLMDRIRCPGLRRVIYLTVSTVARFLFAHTPLEFDRAHGVDTRGWVNVEDLSIANAANRHGYAPTWPKHVAFAMTLVPGPLDRWSFLDVGSGKGRAVLLAMGCPFRLVAGVELAPELHAIAQKNIRRYRGPRQCQTVELICGDATTVALPAGDVVIFFYNSFRGALLRRFLDHLDASLRESARRLLFIYSNPTERELVDSRPAYSIVFDGVSPRDWIWWGNRRLIVYSRGLERSPSSPASSTLPTARES